MDNWIAPVMTALLTLSATSLAVGAPILDGTEVPRNHPISRSTVRLTMNVSSETDSSISSAHICSGSLIEQDVVLTAAHCMGTGMKAFFVDQREGHHFSQPMRGVRATRVHPNYRPTQNDALVTKVPLDFDLAVVLLNKVAPPEYVPATLLPLSEPITPGMTAIAAGYGTTHIYGSKVGIGTLRQTVVSINQEAPSREFIINSMMNSGICSGDSGGPLFLSDSEGNLKLWGVSSRVTDRCMGYGFVVRFANHLDWIREAVREMRETRR